MRSRAKHDEWQKLLKCRQIVKMQANCFGWRRRFGGKFQKGLHRNDDAGERR